MISAGLAKITGHVKIHDPNSGEIFYNDHNAIHYENISIAMAQTLSDTTAPETVRHGIILEGNDRPVFHHVRSQLSLE